MEHTTSSFNNLEKEKVAFENIVGKGEYIVSQHFLLFSFNMILFCSAYKIPSCQPLLICLLENCLEFGQVQNVSCGKEFWHHFFTVFCKCFQHGCFLNFWRHLTLSQTIILDFSKLKSMQ